MPRSNIKYEIANQDADTPDLFLQHNTDFKNIQKQHLPFWWNVLITSLLIIVYFILSVGLTFYQQWLVGMMHSPLSIVLCHLIIKFLLSASVRWILECHNGQRRVKLSCQSMIFSVAPPGIASGFDIGLSNWALQLLTMSMYTMTKSTTLLFILGFAVLFKLEKKSWWLMGIVALIAGGLAMFTYKATEFNYLGFMLALLASISGGLRWTMAQLIMQKSKMGLGNPVDMMYHMQPWMLLPIIPLSLWFEGVHVYNGIVDTDWKDVHAVLFVVVGIIGGAVIAFCMEVTEFLVITRSSSLTLSISSIFKEICTLVLAVEWHGDQMSGLNFAGLLLCLGGIIVHSVQKVVAAKLNKIEELELNINSVMNNVTKSDEGFDTNVPLLISQKSTSLTNLLNENFSSDEDDGKGEENSSQVLFNILQRREQ